jgi:uncharacterized damage-inducible protein DinB
MASYNEWMNAKVYAAAQNLTSEELSANKKAFFGSILGTLNHLVISDTIWLKRFAAHPARYPSLEPIRSLPAPDSLDPSLFTDLQSLTEHRFWLDSVITEWARSIAESDLDFVLHYTNTKGIAADKRFFSLIMAFFSTIKLIIAAKPRPCSPQAGIDVGVTDLLALVPNESDA